MEKEKDEVITETPVVDVNEQIEQLTAEVQKLKNDYALAYADTENIRKRLNNENEQIKKYRAQSFALDILPILDNLERALESHTNKEDPFYIGIEMIYKQLLTALQKEGVQEVEALNQQFDANFMQSIMMEKCDGVETNIVIEVFQKGYKLKDRLLRAAMVKVAE